jgi:2-iminobutanoate/2-iminopropanoate deaminase
VYSRGPDLPPVHLSDAVRVGTLVFLSGRVARDPNTAKVVGTTIEQQTAAILESFRRTLQRAGSSLERVVKVTTFLARREDFTGYDRAYALFFPKDPPVRTTVLAALRPEGALIEMEAIACQ